MRNKNPQDVYKEVLKIVNEIVEPINKAFEEKEANKPKPYSYKGVNITVREVTYKMNGDLVPPGIYNYCVSIDGCFYSSTSKEELEAWIDEFLADDNSK